MNLAQKEKEKSKELMKIVISLILFIISFSFLILHISYQNYKEFPWMVSVFGSILLAILVAIIASKYLKNNLGHELGCASIVKAFNAIISLFLLIFIINYLSHKQEYILKNAEVTKAKILGVYSKRNLLFTEDSYIILEYTTSSGVKFKKDILLKRNYSIFSSQLKDSTFIYYDKDAPDKVFLANYKIVKELTGIDHKDHIKYIDLKNIFFSSDSLIFRILNRKNKGWVKLPNENKWINKILKSKIIIKSNDTLRYSSNSNNPGMILHELHEKSRGKGKYKLLEGFRPLLYEDSLLNVYSVLTVENKTPKIEIELCRKKR